MRLLEIALHNAQFVRNGNVVVTVDEPYEWVAMAAPDSDVFLQGHEAADFIEKFRKLWKDLRDIGLEDAIYATAYEYLDLL